VSKRWAYRPTTKVSAAEPSKVVSKLDEATMGFRPGQLVVISGPTGQGKTAICRTFTKHFVDNGTGVVWFSYEEPYFELFEKMPTLQFYVPSKHEDDKVEWLKEHMLKAKQKGSMVVFIDNLDFLKKPKDMKMPDMNMASYVGAIVQELKSFAVANEMILFLLVHIKKNDWTSKELPTSEDIRDSGMIPQLADFVMFMKRERDETKLQTNYAKFGIDKNRVNGKCIRLDLYYNEERMMFEETTGDHIISEAKNYQNNLI
jgi:replicative DNA helicase